jgi:hypothetical protein
MEKFTVGLVVNEERKIQDDVACAPRSSANFTLECDCQYGLSQFGFRKRMANCFFVHHDSTDC